MSNINLKVEKAAICIVFMVICVVLFYLVDINLNSKEEVYVFASRNRSWNIDSSSEINYQNTSSDIPKKNINDNYLSIHVREDDIETFSVVRKDLLSLS